VSLFFAIRKKLRSAHTSLGRDFAVGKRLRRRFFPEIQRRTHVVFLAHQTRRGKFSRDICAAAIQIVSCNFNTEIEKAPYANTRSISTLDDRTPS
jgi:hypothetical protein